MVTSLGYCEPCVTKRDAPLYQTEVQQCIQTVMEANTISYPDVGQVKIVVSVILIMGIAFFLAKQKRLGRVTKNYYLSSI